jgi:hypothetical protein
MSVREGNAGPFVCEVNDVTVDIASIPAATAPDQAVLVPAARVGDSIQITPLGVWPVGVSQPQGRCLVAGTVQVRVANVTAGAIDPASQTFRFACWHLTPTGNT